MADIDTSVMKNYKPKKAKKKLLRICDLLDAEQKAERAIELLRYARRLARAGSEFGRLERVVWVVVDDFLRSVGAMEAGDDKA